MTWETTRSTVQVKKGYLSYLDWQRVNNRLLGKFGKKKILKLVFEEKV